MARSVSMNLNIGTGNSSKNLASIVLKLRNMREHLEAISKMKFKLDTSVVEKASKNFNQLNREMRNSSNIVNNFNNANQRTAGTTRQAVTELNHYIAAMSMFRFIKSHIPTFLKFEDAVYNLGVVSKQSVSDIEKLKTGILDMSAGLPQTATELALAADVITRTGQTLENALMVTEQSSRLATASGEQLGNTVQIVNKILVAMGISADKAGASMQTLHSTSINTATDLAKMGQASKYWSSALATFSNLTTRSGEDLEKYKQELFDFGAVSTGVLANLGRDSTMAGTGIRTLVSKMANLNSTAKEMLDKNLLQKAVRVDPKTMKLSNDGIQLTANLLSEMAMTDLPKAVNLMSTLFSTGKVALPTIQKMFTTRQGLALASYLQEINGNWEEYSERIKTASDLTEDYEKQMSNLNNQLDIFKGKMTKTMSETGAEVKTVLGASVGILNKMLDSFSGFTKVFSPVITGLLGGTLISLLTKASGRILAITTGITSWSSAMLLLKHPITLVVGGLITMGIALAKIDKHFKDIKASEVAFAKSLVDAGKEVENLKEKIETAKLINEELNNLDMNDPWMPLTNSLMEYANQLKGVEDTYNILGKGIKFDLPLNEFEKATEMEKYYKNRIVDEKERLSKRKGTVNEQTEKSYYGLEMERQWNVLEQKKIEKEMNSLLGKAKTYSNKGEYDLANQYMDRAKKKRVEYHKITEKIADAEERIKPLREKELEISKLNIKYLEEELNTYNKRKEIIDSILSYANELNVAIDTMSSGISEKIISEKTFKNVDDFKKTILEIDKGLGGDISEALKSKTLKGLDLTGTINSSDFIPLISLISQTEKDIEKLNGKINVLGGNIKENMSFEDITNKNIKSYKNEISYIDEKIKALSSVKNISQKDYTEIETLTKKRQSLNENLLASEKALKMDETTRGYESATYKNAISELEEFLMLIRKLFETRKENNKESKKENDLMYNKVKLNNELAKAEYEKNIFPKEGLFLYSAKKEGLEKLYATEKAYSDDQIKWYSRVLNLQNATMGSVKNEINNLEAKDKLTSKEKDRLSKLRNLYNIIDKQKAEEIKHELELLGIDKDKSDYVKKIKEEEIESFYSEEKIKLQSSTYWDSGIKKREKSLDLAKRELEEQLALAQSTGDVKTQEEIRLKFVELQNEELDIQRDKYKEMAKLTTATLVSMSKSEMPQMNFMGGFEKSLGKAFDKEAELTGTDKLNLVAGSIQLIDNVTKQIIGAELESLKFEQQVLSIRLQGATTEKEKQKLVERQLQLQKEAIDLQYEQQTSFMGMASGQVGAGTQGALSGAVSGATIGASVGTSAGPLGAVIGATVGLVGGLFGGSSAKRKAKREKEALEYQREMTEHLKTVSKRTKTSNEYMRTISTDTKNIGLINAQQKVLNDIAMNPTKYEIGGTSIVDFNKRRWRGGFRRRYEDNWITKQASYSLESFGYTATDLQKAENIASIMSDIQAEMLKYSSVEEGYDPTNWIETHNRAQLMALKDMYENIKDISKLYEALGETAFNSYFEGTLKEIEDSSGKVVDFYVDWSTMLSNQFSKAYDIAMGKSLLDANSITSGFFKGISNLYIQNYSPLKDFYSVLTNLYEDVSKELAKNQDEINVDYLTSKIDELILKSKEFKEMQKEVNSTMSEYIELYIKQGGLLSDITDSMTEGMKNLYSEMKGALSTSNYEDMAKGLGENLGKIISDKMIQNIIDAKYSDAFLSLNNSIMSAIEGQSIQSILGLVGQSNSLLAQLENDRRQMEAITSLFDYDKQIEYTNESQNIEYTTGTTKDVSYTYNIITNANIGNYIASDESLDDFSDAIATRVKDSLDRMK